MAKPIDVCCTGPLKTASKKVYSIIETIADECDVDYSIAGFSANPYNRANKYPRNTIMAILYWSRSPYTALDMEDIVSEYLDELDLNCQNNNCLTGGVNPIGYITRSWRYYTYAVFKLPRGEVFPFDEEE